MSLAFLLAFLVCVFNDHSLAGRGQEKNLKTFVQILILSLKNGVEEDRLLENESPTSCLRNPAVAQ